MFRMVMTRVTITITVILTIANAVIPPALHLHFITARPESLRTTTEAMGVLDVGSPAAAFKAVSLASCGEIAKSQKILDMLNQTLGKASNDTGVSPLFDVIERNDLKTLLWCLKNQCDPNAKADGETPLHRAMRFNVRPKIVQHLLEYSARVDEPDQYGRTPLNNLAGTFYFSDNENAMLKKVCLLLDAGADPNKTGTSFWSDKPLALAISEKNAKLARLLIQRGANTKRASDRSSKSALDLVRETGDMKTMNLVIDLLM